MESILTSIKKLLGIEEDYTHFDTDIIMYINSEFMSLSQIGIGPETGFTISDKTTEWSDYLGEGTNFEAVKSYIYLNVRMIFDPPSSSFVIAAMERKIKEIEWRLLVQGGPETIVVLEEGEELDE